MTNENLIKQLRREAEMATLIADQCADGQRAYNRSRIKVVECDEDLRQILLDNIKTIKKAMLPTVDYHVIIYLRNFARAMEAAADALENAEEIWSMDQEPIVD